ncbi:MAG TPA: histidinol-phosphate transaminase [Anaerohalosphaeraceae bacterium]|nr:histidinol-phosphate transaminase [Phycisphaerae bacterium]HOK95726.1 histidinol-phosphate transaminase [Anaerohalosphaeraceae bacterium]HOL32541.1 histidinol-phosphate transaminase [Anaerohalosphaeraceae bacterium]HOM75533.1 histidinol-phosphate transaminase [Anaerohalosphaeraceae bacterium]HPC64738.1 histidinol-phosphate transaminase [Anaerohalosphaeraceae bacterium]
MGYFRPTIEQMAGYTPGFQPKSTAVVKLNTNENPYPASPRVIQAVQTLDAEKLRRYPDPLGQAFRLAAAEVWAVEPDNIICTNGGDDLLNICVRAFCDAQRPVAYAQPTYSLYPVLAQLQGCPAIEVRRDAGGSLAELAQINAALTIVCNPNAPTCDFLPAEALERLAAHLNGVLLIDEAYADFAEDNALRLVKKFDNVIILRSMSKGYSLAGMRFGCGIAHKNLVAGLMKVRDSYPVNAAAIAAAAAAVSDQAYFADNIRKIKLERTRLIGRLRALGFDVPDSQTNFVLARCVQKEAKAIYNALTEQNIFVRYFELPGLEDKLRITVGTPEQNDTMLAALKRLLD